MTVGERSRRGVVACAAAAVCFGAATPVSRRLLGHVDPFTLAGLLYIGAAVAAAPFARPGDRGRRREAGDRVRLLAAVVVGGGVAPVLLLTGLDRLPSPTVSVLLNLELVVTVLLAVACFGERIDRRAGAGVVLLVVAGVVTVWQRGTAIDPAALLVVAACVGWAVDNTVTAHLESFTAAQITTAKGVVAGPVNLVLGLVTSSSGVPSTARVVLALLVGAVGYGLSIMLWIAGARRIGAARGQAVFATAPFVGVLLAWPIVGERLDARAGVGCLLAVAGVAAVIRVPSPVVHRHGPVTHVHRHRHRDGHHDHPHDAVPGRFGVHVHEHTHEAVEHVHAGRHHRGHGPVPSTLTRRARGDAGPDGGAAGRWRRR